MKKSIIIAIIAVILVAAAVTTYIFLSKESETTKPVQETGDKGNSDTELESFIESRKTAEDIVDGFAATQREIKTADMMGYAGEWVSKTRVRVLISKIELMEPKVDIEYNGAIATVEEMQSTLESSEAARYYTVNFEENEGTITKAIITPNK